MEGFREAEDDEGGTRGRWRDWGRGVGGDDHEAVGEVGGGGEGGDVGGGGCAEDEDGVGGVGVGWMYAPWLGAEGVDGELWAKGVGGHVERENGESLTGVLAHVVIPIWQTRRLLPAVDPVP